jgi:hypothetical protein
VEIIDLMNKGNGVIHKLEGEFSEVGLSRADIGGKYL